jgi:hypothetical protein
MVKPFKANPPALVDADAMLSLPVSHQRLKLIGRRDQQIGEFLGRVQVAEPAQRRSLDFRRQFAENKRRKILSASLSLNDLIMGYITAEW